MACAHAHGWTRWEVGVAMLQLLLPNEAAVQHQMPGQQLPRLLHGAAAVVVPRPAVSAAGSAPYCLEDDRPAAAAADAAPMLCQPGLQAALHSRLPLTEPVQQTAAAAVAAAVPAAAVAAPAQEPSTCNSIHPLCARSRNARLSSALWGPA